ncbi:MAG: ISNCY family transposase [Deltaproteobacteria bacterium]|nr:ISNCY family transposase [Deltaproteobacteria bacterium]
MNVTLNDKEQKRLEVLNLVISNKISRREAADVLDLSLRHTKRLAAAYRKEGAAGLAHGNRGRMPFHALDPAIKLKVTQLARSKYVGFNFSHFTELLGEKEGIQLSRSSVRRILLGNGLRSPKKRKAPKHRSRRPRLPQEGMLLQIDGSPHDWLEGRGSVLCLIGAIDDATGKVPYAHFQAQENSEGYFLLLREITRKYGIPLALYHDRHSIFEVNPDKLPALEEQLAGQRPLTQFGRLMTELGITSISANSPQAKGRIERLWNTFQDRLSSELRLSGAKTLAEANRTLADFLPRFNRKFAVKAAEPGLAYRKVGSGFKAAEYFCYKYSRTVGFDNVVRFGSHRFQLLPSPERASYARCRVAVYVGLDGQVAVYHEGKHLTHREAPLESTGLRGTAAVIPVKRVYTKPAPDHPWRSKYRIFIDK